MASSSSSMQVDPYPYPSTEGVFAELSLWTKILEFATPGTICSFSQVCSRFHALVCIKDYANEGMWRSLLHRDYQMTDSMMKRFAKEDANYRSLYTAFYRSRVSPVGYLSPKISAKHVRRSSSLQRFAKVHGIRPFYVVQLFHTSTHGPKTIVAKHSLDETSHYGQVLELRRCWNIQVEGSVRVWRPGYYRVVWRLKLATDYEDLGPLSFLTKVVTSYELKHLLDETEAEKIDVEECTWKEEIVSPVSILGSHTVYVWNPPNPLPLQPPNPQDMAVHPNDRPFGAPEPEAQPQDDGFGLIAQQNLFQLHNRILQAQGAAAPPERGHAPAAPQAPQEAAPQAPQDPANGNSAENAPFPIGEWFDLCAGFIHVPQAHDAVCFALTNFTIGYKYGLMIDYVALVPTTEREFKFQERFPLGPVLIEGHHYWDTLCEDFMHDL